MKKLGILRMNTTKVTGFRIYRHPVAQEMKGIEIYNSVGVKIKSVGRNKIGSKLTEIEVSFF